MRLVLLAPGTTPPWTEGRKNFVHDSLEKLRELGHEVTLIDAGGADSMPLKLVTSLFDLRRVLATSPKMDGVLIFPFGTF